jgi:signal transduction histidine kinase
LPALIPLSPKIQLPGKPVLAAVYALYTAVVLRTLANPFLREHLSIYLALELVFLGFFSLFLWRPPEKTIWRHLYVIFQSLIILYLLALRPKFDFVTVLFVLLSFQAVLIFSGRTRWIWVGILVLLMGVPLMIALGPLQGLALALLPMTIGIVFPAYVSITHEIETRLKDNQELLEQLQETNHHLQVSIEQAEELSAIQERIRLARDLHDSVSQTIFGITLQTRATQLLMGYDPERLRSQLEQLQALTQGALEEMRGLITQLRPKEDASTARPTP